MDPVRDGDTRSPRERMLAGDDYVGDARFNASSVDDPAGRRAILAELLGGLGDDVEIRPPLHCGNPARVVRAL